MPLNPHPIATLLSALALAALAACGGDDDGAAVDPAPSFAAIELNIAHVNDHHSQLEGFPGTTLTLDGTATRVTLGGFARLTSIFQALEDAGTPNLLKIHAGDAVTGTLYYTFFKGEADARMMNTICFDAFALGNHEFDDGDAQTAAFLDALWTPACQTPILAANVQPAIGTPLAPSAPATTSSPT